MNSNLLKGMLYKSFKFEATSYEVYENGQCIKRAKCNAYISAEYSARNGMMFEIRNNPTYIDDAFTFSIASDDLLPDRVQYGRLSPIDYFSGVRSTPVVCNIFPQNGILRFATPNPLRLVEFSGYYRLV